MLTCGANDESSIASSNAVGSGGADLVVVGREANGSFGAFHAIGTTGAFATPALEGLTAISADGRELFLQVQTPGERSQIVHAIRGAGEATFGAPTALDVVSVDPISRVPSWISPDGCRLYEATAGKDGVYTLDVRTRPAN